MTTLHSLRPIRDEGVRTMPGSDDRGVPKVGMLSAIGLGRDERAESACSR